MTLYNPPTPTPTPTPPPSDKRVAKLGRPSGVIPENYIEHNSIQVHNMGHVVLCVEEEALVVPHLVLPRTRVNKQGSTFCSHIYTPKRGAVFYWNTDGSRFTRRVDGSAEYMAPGGFVKKYGVGTYIQPKDMPYIPYGVLESGVVPSCTAQYYETLFQRHHPLAGTADEGLSDQVCKPDIEHRAVHP